MAVAVQVPDGAITAVRFDSADSKLKLKDSDSQMVAIDIDRSVGEEKYFLLTPQTGKPALLRFLPKKCYASIGEESEGLFIISPGLLPDEIKTDPSNSFAKDQPVAREMTIVDASFLAIKSMTSRYNSTEGKPLCTDDDTSSLLRKLRSGACYVACSGLSTIANDMLPAPTRIVLLYSRADKLDGDLSFLWSEWHTTLEVFDHGNWYVADPTYGFAYAKDREVKRLDTAQLIQQISEGEAAHLMFGVLSEDQIHDVPGDRLLQELPSLGGVYYTPDKQPKYQAVTEPPTLKTADGKSDK
ncbi:transglutaminase domain-containing protein [Bradyrhizobium jicamae]|uniref:transglutaminase domain-containing protein n=1 Tax=Bradyrhizobium jicamae TaxID=280332 RepID=UPI001BA55532|nr:transglutaminase domain-containing protein [Bradyrhizobium jicamae]MBR0939425.1 transglutaminase domain-containing protein [Bradyrhizobium jicamae]